MLVEAVDPGFAMKLKQAAGHESATPSLHISPHRPLESILKRWKGEAAADHARFNPIDPQAVAEEEANGFLRRWMPRPKMQRKREGDQGYEERLAREEAKAKAAAERAAEGARLDARIRQKQLEIQNAGRIAAGNVVMPSN